MSNQEPKGDVYSIRTRWVSGIIAGVAVSSMFLSLHAFIALAVGSAAIAGFEYIRIVLLKKNHRLERAILTVCIPALTLAACLFLVFTPDTWFDSVILLYGMLLPLIFAFELFFYKDFVLLKERVIDTVFGFLYISIPLFLGVYIYWKYGWAYALIAVTSTWLFDSFAFFVGIKFGKHPLMPSISPKKTIEGSVGGFLGSFFSLWIYIRIMELFWGKPMFSFLQILILSVGLLLSATFGDLFESVLKRAFALKDIGTILPGHGGLLDRIDSMLFYIPTLLLLLTIFFR